MGVGFIWDNWLLLAWAAPLAWGLGSLVDVFMIEQRVYRGAVQATVVSSMVVSLPFLIFAFPEFDRNTISPFVFMLAMLGGLNYLGMLLFLLSRHVSLKRCCACRILFKSRSVICADISLYAAG